MMSEHRKVVSIVLIITTILLSFPNVTSQRTFLDQQFTSVLRSLRETLLTFVGRTGNDERNYNLVRNLGKLQEQISTSTPFFCDVNGPGRRSPAPPKSVHKLRPGDIDIIGAMGDSLTAGNGAMSTNILEVLIENKGISWSIGGQATWRKFLTIPNILKEFNPDLYGYALSDGFSTHRSSRFDVAEIAAMSRDMPFQARILVKRLKADSKVNMTQHWKLVTIFIGSNDFCSDMCQYENPEVIIARHDKDMTETLRILRDNLPRLMVNYVPAPSMKLLLDLKGLPPECFSVLHFECPCIFGTRVENSRELFLKIMEKWQDKDFEIANRDEFHNSDDFTVNYQPFTKQFLFPKNKYNDLTDLRYMAADCFHLSQKSHAKNAQALWNNMLELEGHKLQKLPENLKDFKCPTKQRPYIITRKNSK